MKSSKHFTSLRQWREEILVRTQRDFAPLCKTSQAQISLVERGHMPRYNQVAKYAKAYQITVEEFKRLVDCARREAALQKPQELPLWQFADRTPAPVASMVPAPVEKARRA